MRKAIYVTWSGLALGAVLAVFFFWREWKPPTSPASAPTPNNGSESKHLDSPIDPVQRRSDGLKSEAETSPDEMGWSATPEDVDAISTPTSFRLRGQVFGVDPGLVVATQVMVQGVVDSGETGEGCVLGGISIEGEIDLDVTSLFERPERPIQLEVSILYPGGVPIRREIVERAPGEFWLEAAVTLKGWVRGYIQDESGTPIAAAEVQLRRISDREPADSPLLETRTRLDGSFQFAIDEDGDYLVSADAAGRQGGMARIHAVPGTEIEIPTIVLLNGLVISGFVRSATGGIQAEAQVSAQPEYSGPRSADPRNVFWSDGNFTRLETVSVDEEGRFSIVGLEPGPYLLSCHVRDGLWGTPDTVERVIESPATDLELTVAVALLHVRATHEGHAIGSARVIVGKGGMGRILETDESGEARLEVEPGRQLDICVRREGFVEAVHRWTAPGAVAEGLVNVMMERDDHRSSGRLMIRLENADGRAVERALVSIEDQSIGLDSSAGRPGGDGLFVVDDIPPGPHRIDIRPWPFANTSDVFVREELVIDVPAGAEVMRTIRVREGGQLRLRVRGPDGQLIPASCTISDRSGQPLDLLFLCARDGGAVGGSYREAMRGRLGTRGWTSVEDVLVPGRYRVDVSHAGFVGRSEMVNIDARKTADLEIVLAVNPAGR